MTIKQRLLLSHLLVALLGAGTLGLYLYLSAAGQLLQGVGVRVLDDVRMLAANIGEEEAAAASRRGSADVARLDERLARNMQASSDLARVFVVEIAGEDIRVIASSNPTATVAGSGSLSVEEMTLLRAGVSVATLADIDAAVADGTDLTALAPIGPAPSRYVAGLRLNASSLQASLRTLRLSTLGGTLLAVLAALVLSRLLS